MKKMLVLIMLVAFATTAFAADIVTMTAKNGNVTFDHKAHSAKMECKTCHGEGTPAKIELDKDAAHALCKDCHTKGAAGPTKCGDCHKK